MKGGFARLGLTAVALAAIALAAERPDVFGRAYGPKGKLIVSRPTLMWEIWSTGPDRIVGTTALVDGKPVRAQYDSVLKRVEASPAAPFSAGKHEVEFTVLFSDGGTVKKDWSFEIAANAHDSLPEPSAEQLRAFAWTNTVRKSMGLPECVLDSRLNLVSMLHSQYLAANQTTGHFQKPDLPGFLGVEPGDRVAAMGMIADCAEVVEFGSGTPEEALRNLLDAPYHRLPFMQPGNVSFGSGFHRNRMTVTFALGSLVQTTVYPYDNQSDVPLRWDKTERPNPLRMHSAAKRPVGYPIVFAYFAREPLRLTVRSAKLTDGGGYDVPIFLNTPQNDDQLINAAFLIPKTPLLPNKTYVAQVSATVPGEVDVSRTWSFSTRAR